MAHITITGPDGEHRFDCDEETPILEAAQAAGLDLPFGCRGGLCGKCVHVITEGDVDQGSQMALDPERVAEGYTVLCIGRPVGDVSLRHPALAEE